MERRNLEATVMNHQARVSVPDAWLPLFEQALRLLAAELADGAFPGAPLHELAAFDVSLLDDAMIGEVHGRFMGDPTPTDVITFDHGEILIGAETALRQAAEHGEPLARELLRYTVHGMLHLAGHDDRDEADRQRMEQVQEEWVGKIWESLGPQFGTEQGI